MRGLLPQLVLRVLAAGLITVLVAAGWVLWDTARAARADATVTATRVAGAIDARPDFVGLAFGGVAPTPVFRDWQQFPAWTLIAPGICVEFGATDLPTHRRCGPYLAADAPTPAWFVRLADAIGLVPDPIAVPVRSRRAADGRVTAIPDATVVVSRAWARTGDLMRVAVGMAIGGAVVTGLMVARLLAPFRLVLRGIERLRAGDFSTRQPRLAVAEFDALAEALNETAAALREARDTRTELTRRLFTVQESERRALARELHDEFGQCLTATRALATAIAQSGETTAHDGARIAEISGQMMDNLRAELSRLRPPDLDELGLEPALDRLVAGWRARMPAVRFSLRCRGDLDAVPDALALSLYRIAQECLTNAIRHGAPKSVALAVDVAESVTLVTTDDGTAKPEAAAGDGYGLLGIRERVDALGGRFTLEPGPKGMVATAVVPR
ncbi:histidine kinase [Oharaeibacter diazotrophicus]|uniref:Signal transduction histidine kinase n=1 Tax=Oharaeibacter diazotrophicus TaxID=1920512 RepID=A0A4R6REW4_9HYPH|nr:histidine kinase [Oharaeibacter diazotrophicus]TDP84206.1 signal transduction histidine kinase [Oharaeibacter diazotrophicus]BBE73244.1 sensor histidine kinase ComP [Pleomorphomonas sp. SM30]GLS75035.1 histidine kinase [Oharaeibacter diazotrophicus]